MQKHFFWDNMQLNIFRDKIKKLSFWIRYNRGRVYLRSPSLSPQSSCIFLGFVEAFWRDKIWLLLLMAKCLHETIFKSSLRPKRPSRVSNHQLLGCLKPTDQPPLFVDEEMKKLNCLLLSIFNSSFNLSILSSSLFSSSCILQMSTSSARYFGMFILSDFHIFECLNQRTVSFDWGVERERKGWRVRHSLHLGNFAHSGIPTLLGGCRTFRDEQMMNRWSQKLARKDRRWLVYICEPIDKH